MVRTFFEPEQQEEYEAARDLLIHRCVLWAQPRGLPADRPVLAAALDSRQLSTDGRLTLWTPAHVRRLLLEWIPGKVAADPAELVDAPQSVRTLLRFLVDSGLRDPRGASTAENEAAIRAAAAELPAALADRSRWGVGKFWALAARDNQVDPTDPQALSRFAADIQHGRASYDEELLERLMAAPTSWLEQVPERTIAQLPVSLPPPEELADLAARGQIVRQLGAFVAWVGADGRVLTAAGNLRPADARELIDLLGTGEQGLSIRSSAELPRLNLIFTWARKARLVRGRTKLVQVAKAKPLLADAMSLWQRAFEAFFDLRDAVCLPILVGGGRSILHEVYSDVVPDVLNTIYSMPHPTPVARLEDSVWLSCRQSFNVDAGTRQQQEAWRRHVGRDLRRIFEVLAMLGAVEVSHGVADEMFSIDLTDDFDPPFPAHRPISGPAADRLREKLAQPGDLVALTPLGTGAMRRRLLAEGREAGLIGDLLGAEPAELLGTIAEHYTPEAATAEITGWLAEHGDDRADGDRADGAGIGPLLGAVRDCPFRGRAAAMLNVLHQAIPDGTALLHRLRNDPELAPLALAALLEEDILQPDDLTEREQILIMTEAFLQLLEMAGPAAVRAQVEAEGADPSDLLTAMRACGHPGTPTLHDFEALVVGRPTGPSGRPRPARPRA